VFDRKRFYVELIVQPTTEITPE